MAQPQHALGMSSDLTMKHMSYLWIAPQRAGNPERGLDSIDDTPMAEAYSRSYSPFHEQINCSVGQWAKFLYRLKAIRVTTPWGSFEGPRWSSDGVAPDEYIRDENDIPQFPGVAFVATSQGVDGLNLYLYIGIVGDDRATAFPTPGLKVLMSDIFHHGGFEPDPLENAGIQGWVSRRAALYTQSGRVFPFIYLYILKGNYEFEAPSTGRFHIEIPPLQQHIYDTNGRLQLFDWDGSIPLVGNESTGALPQLHPDITVTATEYYTYDDIWDPVTGEKVKEIVIH